MEDHRYKYMQPKAKKHQANMLNGSKRGSDWDQNGQDSFEPTWEKFTPCLVKPGIDTICGGCHAYFRADVVQCIYHFDGKEILRMVVRTLGFVRVR